MKKACCMMLILLLTAGVLPAGCAGTRNSSSPGEVILYTCYRQTGWGDRVEIGCVDGDGGLWLLTGYDSELQWPEDPEEQLSFLASCRRMENAGKLSSGDLFELKSLISGTEDQGRAAHPSAEDAGTEKSWAVQRNADGTAQWILLGVSGDDCFENTDPDAQALYACLRRLFPGVTHYGGTMGPAGFLPVSVRSFCGMAGPDLNRAVITGGVSDCEAGFIPAELSGEEAQRILDLILHGVVTGKANASAVTGGTNCFTVSDPEGRYLASLELYRGLLVRPDGMYTVAIPSIPAEEELLSFTINGAVYRMGVSTPADLAADGWAYETEWDGTYSFRVPGEETYFYAATDGGKAEDPIILLNLMWAQGLSAGCCGFSADGDDGIRLWDRLIQTFGAEVNEDGTLTARCALRGGRELVIETKDTLFCLSLIP